MTCLSTATAGMALHGGLPGPIAETSNPPRYTVATPKRPGEPTGIWDMVGSLGLVLEPSKPNTPILRRETLTPQGLWGPGDARSAGVRGCSLAPQNLALQQARSPGKHLWVADITLGLG